MTITFIGHGYVGLVSAAVFADLGNTVWVIGHTKEKIENLKKGIIPIYEPGLKEIVKRNVDAGRLLFTMDYKPAVPSSDVIFIAVGTPPKKSGEADLSVVFDVAKKVGKYIDGYTVLVTKSTVPVGTNRKVKAIVENEKTQKGMFDIASVPEFLREGQAIADTRHPDRIILGTESKKAQEILTKLHKPIVTDDEKPQTRLVLTNIETAEMIKYASNAFLATKISFANAIAKLSEHVGAQGPAVLEAIGLDSRIGSAFLNAGAGYGGSCFPKDVKALISISDSYGYNFKLLKEVERVNKETMKGIVTKAKQMLGGKVSGKTIGILGLSFKPDTDDMREAPSITVIGELLKQNAHIRAYDPVAMDNAKHILKRVTFCRDSYDVAKNADILILMTEWDEFRQIDLKKIRKEMKTPMLLDGRNIYDPDTVRSLGFAYKGVGR